jgi:uncharacterized protein DUF4157
MRDGHKVEGNARSGAAAGEASRATSAPGKQTQVERIDVVDGAVQRRAAAGDGGDASGVHAAAAHGLQGSGASLPHAERIQRAFGRHDVSGVQAHVGGDAAAACDAMGAQAYASGAGVAFARAPDLHTAAHEAAHVVQQRGGVQLKAGVGAVGDAYEQHADRVADLVVAGHSAEAELDGAPGGGGGGSAAVQRKPPTDTEQMHADIYGDSSLAHAPGGGGGGGDAAPAYKDTVHYLINAPFGWAKYKAKPATSAIVDEWLDYFSFHEPHPLDREHEDRCQFNGSTAYFTANVASIFVTDARGAAALTYDWAAVKAQIDAKLAPLRAARLAEEQAINSGKAPGPGNAPKSPAWPGTAPPPTPTPAPAADSSTQTSIQWTFVPTTVHKEIKPNGEKSKDPPAQQITGQWTQQFHKDGNSGGELFAGAQVTLSADFTTQQIRVQSLAVTAGGQWVFPFLHDFIELQPVAQVVLGATIQPGTPVNGAMTTTRITPGAQLSLGGNAVFNVPGTDKKVQVVVQGSGSTSVGSGAPTLDGSVGVGVTFVLP